MMINEPTNSPPNPDGLSPTVRRAEDIRLGREVAKPGKFEFATIGNDKLDMWLSDSTPSEGEEMLAEAMVELRDVAMDARLRAETVADFLSDHPGLLGDPHTVAWDEAMVVHERLGEIIRLSGSAIEPYIAEAVKHES